MKSIKLLRLYICYSLMLIFFDNHKNTVFDSIDEI